MTTDKPSVARYIFDRVAQLDIHNVFGVPGDFNLVLLDYIEAMKDMEWIGCCNELNAAYAADGYARIRQKPGVLVTTYGVGELSALNGISGSRAENVPIVHIVGMTGRPVQEQKLVIHHANWAEDKLLEETDHLLYMQASKPFSCCSEVITDLATAAQQVDRVFTEVIKQSSPGYIYLPVDMFGREIGNAKLLEQPLEVKFDADAQVVGQCVDAILDSIYSAKNPGILVDVLTSRYNLRETTKTLVDKTGFYAYTSSMGKGIVDENHKQFVGVYNGQGSAGGIADAVHAMDLVLNVGPLISDSNTGGFTREIKDENVVLLHPKYVTVKGKRYDVSFVPVMEQLVKQVDSGKCPKAGEKPTVAPLAHVAPKHDQVMSQTEFVECMSKAVKPHDTMLVESGTFQFAAHDVQFKEDNAYLTQIYYSSIGFTLPAMLGAAVARREQNHPGRVILVEGDGSAQMTIQDLSTVIRYGLKPVVFLLNNDGYSIERAIWGPQQKYNDICTWKWGKICEALGGSDETVANHLVRNKKELDDLIASGKLDDGSKMHMVEVMLDKYDYPWRLAGQVKTMGGKNMKLFQEYSKKHDE